MDLDVVLTLSFSVLFFFTFCESSGYVYCTQLIAEMILDTGLVVEYNFYRISVARLYQKKFCNWTDWYKFVLIMFVSLIARVNQSIVLYVCHSMRLH